MNRSEQKKLRIQEPDHNMNTTISPPTQCGDWVTTRLLSHPGTSQERNRGEMVIGETVAACGYAKLLLIHIDI